MWQEPLVQQLHDDRLHLSHGPIDVVLKAWGAADAKRAAHEAAARRFATILRELCIELEELRRPMCAAPRARSPVGQRMLAACRPFVGDAFLTPMAAVAGSVADELLDCMRAAAELKRAYVNDGGDIALFLTPGTSLDIGIAGDFDGHDVGCSDCRTDGLRSGTVPVLDGRITLTAWDGVGGIATSGARGRSFSLGIADSVTVLAASAAIADAAATLVANAVDIDSPEIIRRRASELDPDSDLGEHLVTVDVGRLSATDIDIALDRGARLAQRFVVDGRIRAAALQLRGRHRLVGAAAITAIAPSTAAGEGPT